MRGLRMQDTEIMTLGMWIDYVVEWNNIHLNDGRKTEKRKAKQIDFDMF